MSGMDELSRMRFRFALRAGTVLASALTVGVLIAIRQGSALAYWAAVVYTLGNACWRVRINTRGL